MLQVSGSIIVTAVTPRRWLAITRCGRESHSRGSPTSVPHSPAIRPGLSSPSHQGRGDVLALLLRRSRGGRLLRRRNLRGGDVVHHSLRAPSHIPLNTQCSDRSEACNIAIATQLSQIGSAAIPPAMERETELTQTWNPEVADRAGGFLNGIPLLVGGELKTFSLPTPLDDDGTDISLKDWQLGPPETAAPYSIKPFKGSVRTRFTPVEPRLDEDLSPRGQSSPEHFETTPTTPRTPRTSSSGTRSSSVSPSKTFLQEGDQTLLASLQRDDHCTPTTGSESNSSLATSEEPHATTPRGIAFDVTLDNQTLAAATTDTNNKSNRSLRVSFVEASRPGPPVVRHKSPLKSRSLHPAKEAKGALQPKWESSTKIRHPISSSTSATKLQVQAPSHGVKRRTAPPAASPVPVPAPEIESEFHDASGYFSEGRGFSSRRTLDSQLMGHSRGGDRDYSSTYVGTQVVRDLTMSPVRDSKVSSQATLPRSFGRREQGGRYDDDDDDDEDVKAGMRCGGGLSDTKLSGDFVRLLSKLCRVSVPPSKQPTTKSGSRGRKFERSNIVTSLSWDPTTQKESMRESIGRHDSLKLLSEKCSNAPTPTYDVHKPRKTRDHEPHIHFYKSISKTLDQKLKR